MITYLALLLPIHQMMTEVTLEAALTSLSSTIVVQQLSSFIL